jgi:hypothetical protein
MDCGVMLGAVSVLLVNVCVPARFTSVSVAAGTVTVTLLSAPVGACTVMVPLVALASTTLFAVPDVPSTLTELVADVAFPLNAPVKVVAVMLGAENGTLAVAPLFVMSK